MADSTTHQNIMQAFYDHIVNMVTFTPKGAKAPAAYHPDTTLVQLDSDGSINPSDYKNMLSPSTGNTGNPDSSENFFLLTDKLGGLGPSYIPSTTSVSAAYKLTIDTATSDSTVPADEQKRYQKAHDVLYTTATYTNRQGKKSTSITPTQAYNIYKQTERNYNVALAKFSTAQLEAGSSHQAEMEWQIKSKQLLSDVDNAYTDWISAGQKEYIEEQINIMGATGKDVDSEIIADAKRTMTSDAQASNTLGGSSWYVTFAQPSTWWDDGTNADDSSGGGDSGGFGGDSSGGGFGGGDSGGGFGGSSSGGGFGGGDSGGGFGGGDSGGFGGGSSGGGFGGGSGGDSASSKAPTGWMSYTLNSNSTQTSSNSHFSSSASAGWSIPIFGYYGDTSSDTEKSSGTASSSQNLVISCELMTVTIERPWLNDLLFKANDWHMNGEKAGWVSKGDALDPVKSLAAAKEEEKTGRPSELLPIIPTAFVVAKNVKITGNWSSSDKSSLHDATTSSTKSWNFGPFYSSPRSSSSSSDDQSSSNSSFDGETLSIPGMQIVAWINELVPFSPPKDSP